MDDIFYLSPAKLNTDCMCKIFQNVESIYVESFKLSGVIQINTGRQQINMILMGALEFDKSGQEFIQTHEIESIVCISHHKSCVKETLELAKMLLDRYGGWIGNDNDGFLPVFDAANISSFSY